MSSIEQRFDIGNIRDQRWWRGAFGVAFVVAIIVGMIAVDMSGGRKAVALDAVAIGATESEVLQAVGLPDRKTESESQARDRADWNYTTLTLQGFRHHGFKFENGRVVDIFKR